MKSLTFALSAFAFTSAVSFAAKPTAPTTPAVETPAAFRDTAGSEVAWKTAEPADAFSRGEWWRVFGDPALDELMQRALANNQDLRAAVARVEQARAIAGVARSQYWPQLAVGAEAVRARTSTTTENTQPETVTTTYRTPLIASWEIDLFGRVRHLTAAARADLQATAAELESVRLALTTEVAATVFSLRAHDIEQHLVRDGVLPLISVWSMRRPTGARRTVV